MNDTPARTNNDQPRPTHRRAPVNHGGKPATEPHIVRIEPDADYLVKTLRAMLNVPSPTGYTDEISRWVCKELDRLRIEYELTRRGAIRATLRGRKRKPNRALVVHLDTLGAMVTRLKDNGRLACAPIGTWSARFAEGGRCTIFTDAGHQRGTIIPLKASGHVYGDEIDTQPISWDNVEVRIDDMSRNSKELFDAGFRVGDYIAIDPRPEFLDNGYIVSRHLDDKAGVAALLTAAKGVLDHQLTLPIDCHLLFTISEEVGTGASSVLHQDAAEMVSIDNATNAPEQNSSEYDVNIAMMDSSGPFDWHLTRKLLTLAREHGIVHGRDVFRHYRSDAASALEAGNDIRTALLCFGVDSSHGHERTHLHSLTSLSSLLTVYMQSGPAVTRDKMELGPLRGFPHQPTAPPPELKKRGPDATGQHDQPVPPPAPRSADELAE